MFLLANDFKMIGMLLTTPENTIVFPAQRSIDHCARSGPKKLTKTYNKGFPNHSTLINYALGYLFSFHIYLFIYLFFQSFS